MSTPIKILYITQEITPFLDETVIAGICRNLPQAIQERGCEVRIFMPKFGNVNERRNQLHEVIRLSGMNIIIDDTDHQLIIKVASIQPARMQIYFIDNDDFFNRKSSLKDENGNEFEDNDERSIFFIRGVMETAKKLRWSPDIIHCHGWLSCIAPLYIKKMYNDDPCFKNTKIITSLYDNAFSKPWKKSAALKMLGGGINILDVKSIVDKEIDFDILSKFAIDYSDATIEGSQNVSPEILEYAKADNKPHLPFQDPENYFDAYKDFYAKLVGTPEE